MGCSCGTGLGQLVLVGEGSVTVGGSGSATDPFRIGNGGVTPTLQLEVRDSSTVNMSLFGSGTKVDPYIIRADTSSASSLRGLSDVSATPVVQQGAVPLWIGSVAGGRFEMRLPGTRYTTNATRGSGVYQGEVIKETDTGKRYEWDGTQWVDLAPATVPPTALDASVVQNQGTVAVTTDWNSLTSKSGIYRIAGWNTGLNAPSGAYNYGTLVVYISGNSVTQTYFEHSSNYSWIRTKYNVSDWTGWDRQVKKGDLDAEISNRANDVNDVRNNKVFDIARIGHSGYNNGGLNGFWQGYLPDNYYNKSQVYNTGQVDGIKNQIYSDYDNGRLDGRTASVADARVNVTGLQRIAAGGVANLAGGSTASVTYPSGRFTTQPRTTTGIYTGSVTNQHAGIINNSSTGFTLYYARDGSSSAATVDWIAVQAAG